MTPTETLHPDPEQVRLFGLGRLPDDQARLVESHVAGCDRCAAALEQVGDDTLISLLRRPDTRTDRPEGATPSATWAGNGVPGGEAAPADTATVPPALRDHPRYRVLRLLGRGGMGDVYLAEHRHLGRRVALKAIRPSLLDSPAAALRFRQEVAAVGRLAHPNIVHAQDAEEAAGRCVLVMEYVEGTSLAERLLRQGRLPVAEACACARQAALGLQCAHENGLVHRDIKPHNLMRTPDGTVKVLDFGLARVLREQAAAPPDPLTGEGAVMGTADYIAPEQARDSRQADIRADIYSLGCTLYHLLAGRVPFPGGTAIDKIVRHSGEEPEPLSRLRPDLPAGLARVVGKMMARDPAARYQTPAEVAAALAPFVGPDLPRRRRRLRAAVVALVLAAAAVAAAAVYRIETDNGQLVITTASDDVEVVVKQGGKVVRILDTKTDRQIALTLRSGTYELELEGAPRGLSLNIDKATLTRGETVVVKIERLPPPAAGGNAAGHEPPGLAPVELPVVRRLFWPDRNGLHPSFSEDGRWCVGWGRDAFRVWEVATGKPVQASPEGLPPILGVRFLPDGRQLLSAHEDGSFRRWDRATGALLAQFGRKPGWAVIQPSIPAAGDALALWYGPVEVWDLKTGKLRFRVEPPEGGKSAASAPLSPDGKRLLTLYWDRDGVTHVRLFDAATGELLLSKPAGLRRGDVGTWSADSRRIYLNGGPDAAHLVCLDAQTGEPISEVRLEPEPGESRGRGFSRNARYFAAQCLAGDEIRLYETRTGKDVGWVSGWKVEFSVSFSPDGRYLACGGPGKVLLYGLPALPDGEPP